MNTVFTTILFVLFLSNGSFAQKRNCLKYEPDIVTLSGVIERHTFPGRPNYESIKNGDEPETVWILKLQKSICVVAADSDQFNETEYNARRMHLVLQPQQYKQYEKLLNRKVVVTGTLFHAITGHHHTKVLLRTNEIKVQ